MPLGELRDLFQFSARKHFPGWIARSIHDDGLRPLRDDTIEIRQAERPLGGVRPDETRDRFDRQQSTDVIGIRRLEQHDFIAGIQQSQARAMKRAGTGLRLR